MYDKDFLQWTHDRLIFQHAEPPNVDYMHKLRAVIAATDAEQLTPNVVSAPVVVASEGESKYCDRCSEELLKVTSVDPVHVGNGVWRNRL